MWVSIKEKYKLIKLNLQPQRLSGMLLVIVNVMKVLLKIWILKSTKI